MFAAAFIALLISELLILTDSPLEELWWTQPGLEWFQKIGPLKQKLKVGQQQQQCYGNKSNHC